MSEQTSSMSECVQLSVNPVNDVHAQLPDDIHGYKVELMTARESIARIVWFSDGMIGNFVGLDAVVGLIPGVGALYTLGVGSILMRQSLRFNFSQMKTLGFAGVTLIDALFGVVPAGGDLVDLFVRIHAWQGNALLEHIDKQIAVISHAEMLLANGGTPDLRVLRQALFG